MDIPNFRFFSDDSERRATYYAQFDTRMNDATYLQANGYGEVK